MPGRVVHAIFCLRFAEPILRGFAIWISCHLLFGQLEFLHAVRADAGSCVASRARACEYFLEFHTFLASLLVERSWWGTKMLVRSVVR